MYLFLIVGHTGQGKTTFVKRTTEGRNNYVFDVNNEYPYPDDRGNIYPQFRHIDFNEKRYTQICSILKNYNCIFEDATGYLNGKQADNFIRVIAAKRHSGNNYFLLFHSINAVPPRLMEMANFVVLFKTGDDQQAFKKFTNPKLLTTFLELKKLPDYSFKTIKTI